MTDANAPIDGPAGSPAKQADLPPTQTFSQIIDPEVAADLDIIFNSSENAAQSEQDTYALAQSSDATAIKTSHDLQVHDTGPATQLQQNGSVDKAAATSAAPAVPAYTVVAPPAVSAPMEHEDPGVMDGVLDAPPPAHFMLTPNKRTSTPVSAVIDATQPFKTSQSSPIANTFATPQAVNKSTSFTPLGPHGAITTPPFHVANGAGMLPSRTASPALSTGSSHMPPLQRGTPSPAPSSRPPSSMSTRTGGTSIPYSSSSGGVVRSQHTVSAHNRTLGFSPQELQQSTEQLSDKILEAFLCEPTLPFTSSIQDQLIAMLSSLEAMKQTNQRDHIPLTITIDLDIIRNTVPSLVQMLLHQHRLACYRIAQALKPSLQQLLSANDLKVTIPSKEDADVILAHLLTAVMADKVWVSVRLLNIQEHHGPPTVPNMQRYGSWFTMSGTVRSVLTPALEDVVRQEVEVSDLDVQAADEKPKRRKSLKGDPDSSGNGVIKPVIHIREQLLFVQCDGTSMHCVVLLSGVMIGQVKPGTKIQVTGEASIFAPRWHEQGNNPLRHNSSRAQTWVVANSMRVLSAGDTEQLAQKLAEARAPLEAFKEQTYLTDPKHYPEDSKSLPVAMARCFALTVAMIHEFLPQILPTMEYTKLKLQLLLVLSCSGGEVRLPDESAKLGVEPDAVSTASGSSHASAREAKRLDAIEWHDRLSLMVFNADVRTRQAVHAIMQLRPATTATSSFDQIQFQPRLLACVTLYRPLDAKDHDNLKRLLSGVQHVSAESAEAESPQRTAYRAKSSSRRTRVTSGISMVCVAPAQAAKRAGGSQLCKQAQEPRLLPNDIHLSRSFDMVSICNHAVARTQEATSFDNSGLLNAKSGERSQARPPVSGNEINEHLDPAKHHIYPMFEAPQLETLKQHFALARSIPVVSLSDHQAGKLLHGYWTRARHNDPAKPTMVKFDDTDFQTLIRLARSHARLHLRESINVCDALVAIMLMEESMAVRGSSKLGIQACPTKQADSLAIFDQPIFIGKTPVRSAVTRFMVFAERVLKFVGPTDAAEDEADVGYTQVSNTATYANGH